MSHRPRHEHKPLRKIRELIENRRYAQLFEIADSPRNQAHRDTYIALLIENIGAKTRLILEIIGKINVSFRNKFLLVLLREKHVAQRFRILRRQDLFLRQRIESTIDAQRRIT